MPLSTNDMALLDVCAKAIVLDQPSDIDLSSFFRDMNFYEEDILKYLVEQVELISQKKHTVRDVDNALLDSHPTGSTMCFARCPIETPKGTVTELTDDMLLASLGPYNRGLRLHVEKASPEKVAEYREFVARSNAERMEREAIEAITGDQIKKIKSRLQSFVDACDDEKLRSRLAYQLKNMYEDPKLKDILAMCHLLGVNFAVVTAEALA